MSEDYSKILDVRLGASHSECREAYIALAKQWHPDINKSPDAVTVFSSLSVAYASSLEATGSKTRRPMGAEQAVSAVRCTHCSIKIRFPRKAEFVGVLSLLVWSWRWKTSGIFCQQCARSAALKTSAISLFFGWWSLQGLVFTPIAIFHNVTGGYQDKAANFKLSCHNLFALTAAGDVAGARVLARLITAHKQSLPLSVVRLIASLTAEPCESPRPIDRPRGSNKFRAP